MPQKVLLLATQEEHDDNLEIENHQPDWGGGVGRVRGLVCLCIGGLLEFVDPEVINSKLVIIKIKRFKYPLRVQSTPWRRIGLW